MADVKISALPASTTPLAGTEVLPIVQSGTTVKVSVANLTAGRAIGATDATLTGALSVTPTWNNGATTFTGIGMNVTDTASAAGSLLLNLQVGGTSRTRIDKIGNISFPNSSTTQPSAAGIGNWAGTLGIFGTSGSLLATCSSTNINFSSTASISWDLDTYLRRDAANTLAQRNSTNAQTFRVYNTFTDASNYERGKFEWASNVLRIGTEKAGTGTARALELQTDGTTRVTIPTTDASGGGIQFINFQRIAQVNPNSLPNNYQQQGFLSGGSTTDSGAYYGITVFRSHSGSVTTGAGYALGTFSTRVFQTTNTWTESAYIRTISTETHSNTALGTRMAFATTANASTTVTERLALEASGLLTFGGSTSSFPALKRNSTALETKLADDSAYAPHAMQYLDINDGITAPAAATGRARIYVDTADGDLKVIFADGTIKTIVTDT
jgi:hypothetical protein